MAEGARVGSIEALKMFRRALFKFAEASSVALTDAESEGNRLLMWLQTEQLTYWQGQIRKRTELVSRCEEAVRMKKLYVDAAGRRSSAIDEVKALEKAKRSLEVAQQKFSNTRAWARKLEREMQNYKGTVQRFATTVQSDLPVAAAKLESAILRLEEYLKLGVPSDAASALPSSGSEPTAAPVTELESIARPPAVEEPAAPESAEAEPETSSEPRE
jgi:exonuclease VII small subunit